MGVVSGDCCGMARYQTVMSIGNFTLIGNDSKLKFCFKQGYFWL